MYCAALPTTLDDLRLRKWVQAMGDLSAWDITSDMLDAASHALIESGLGVSTVNRDLSALGSVYRWAKAKRLSPRGFRSPTLGAQRFAEPIRRVEVSREDLERLKARVLAVRDRRFGVFVHLLLDTGARKSELLLRRWRDVDLEAGTIHCEMTKTGLPRVLHFRPETAELIRRAFKTMSKEKLIFEGRLPGTPINFRTIWRTVTADLGKPDLHLHDLRHLAAADLLRAGGPGPATPARAWGSGAHAAGSETCRSSAAQSASVPSKPLQWLTAEANLKKSSMGCRG